MTARVPLQGERDPGLQPERTQLAWQRTAIGVVLGCAVLSMTVARHGHAAIAALAALLGFATAWWALRTATRRRLAVQHPPWAPLVRAAGAVALLGLLGTAAAIQQLTS